MMVNLSKSTGDQDDDDACEALCHAIDVGMPISGHGTVVEIPWMDMGEDP